VQRGREEGSNKTTLDAMPRFSCAAVALSEDGSELLWIHTLKTTTTREGMVVMVSKHQILCDVTHTHTYTPPFPSSLCVNHPFHAFNNNDGACISALLRMYVFTHHDTVTPTPSLPPKIPRTRRETFWETATVAGLLHIAINANTCCNDTSLYGRRIKHIREGETQKETLSDDDATTRCRLTEAKRSSTPGRKPWKPAQGVCPSPRTPATAAPVSSPPPVLRKSPWRTPQWTRSPQVQRLRRLRCSTSKFLQLCCNVFSSSTTTNHRSRRHQTLRPRLQSPRQQLSQPPR
jgi:hypothetical protein